MAVVDARAFISAYRHQGECFSPHCIRRLRVAAGGSCGCFSGSMLWEYVVAANSVETSRPTGSVSHDGHKFDGTPFPTCGVCSWKGEYGTERFP